MFCPLEVAHKSGEIYIWWHLRTKQRHLLTFRFADLFQGCFSSGDGAKFPNEILDEVSMGACKLTAPACQGSQFFWGFLFLSAY